MNHVVPKKAGIHAEYLVRPGMGPRLRGDDGQPMVALSHPCRTAAFIFSQVDAPSLP